MIENHSLKIYYDKGLVTISILLILCSNGLSFGTVDILLDCTLPIILCFLKSSNISILCSFNDLECLHGHPCLMIMMIMIVVMMIMMIIIIIIIMMIIMIMIPDS